jgi:hypothetical protein
LAILWRRETNTKNSQTALGTVNAEVLKLYTTSYLVNPGRSRSFSSHFTNNLWVVSIGKTQDSDSVGRKETHEVS